MTNCLNCGSGDTEHWAWAEDIEYRTSDDRWEYRRCRACDVLYLPSPPIDRLDEIYPSNYYSFRGERRSLVNRVKSGLDQRMLRRFLRGIPGHELSVLDIGGGTGYMASKARQADARVATTTIVDLDERCRADAEDAGHTFIASRVEELDVPERFDAILALNLIEHVADPRLVLRTFRSLLGPGGRVLVKTPNINALDARLFRHRSWGGLHCPRHWVLFDRESLSTAAAASGLEVDRLDHTQGAPFWTVSLLDALERKRLLRRQDGTALIDHPLFGPVAAATAAFDLVRRPFARTSQMIAVLRPDSISSAADDRTPDDLT